MPREAYHGRADGAASMPGIEVGELRAASIAFLRRQAYFGWVFAAVVLLVGVGSLGPIPPLSGSSDVVSFAVVGIGVFLAVFGVALYVYPNRRMPVARLEILPEGLRLEMAKGGSEGISFAPPRPGNPWASTVVGLVDRSEVKRERPEDQFTLWYVDRRRRLRAIPLDKACYDAVLVAWRAGGGRMREDSREYPREQGTVRGYTAIR
jgi:hypothetical protein